MVPAGKAASPALAPTSDTIAAIRCSSSSESLSEMDCSSSSDVDSDDVIGMDTRSTWATRPASAAVAVPELNLGGIAVAPQPHRAYQSEKVECMQTETVTPPWRDSRPRHVSDPGDGMARKSVTQSMPTFRDFLGHAPLSESGVFAKPAALQPQPQERPQQRTAAPEYAVETQLEKKLAAVAATSISISASASGTQLTFRDLLPPLGSGERSAPLASTPPTGPTPVSKIPRAASRIPSRYPSGTDVSTGYDSAPSTSCALHERSSLAIEPLRASVLFTEAGGTEAVALGSPCMSCASPTPPGSVLRNDGGILEVPDSSELLRGSGSPPSLTPPNVWGARGHLAQARRHGRGSAGLNRPLSALRRRDTGLGSTLMDVDQPLASQHHRLGQLRTSVESDKENSHAGPPVVGKKVSAQQQVGSHPWPGDVHVLPLQCVTEAYTAHEQALEHEVQPAPGALEHNAAFDAAELDEPGEEPAAWRARHFRGLTLDMYITDELICEAIEATRRCAPAAGAQSAHRQLVVARPLTPDDLRPLECCSRPASAPPGSQGPLDQLAGEQARWTRSHGGEVGSAQQAEVLIPRPQSVPAVPMYEEQRYAALKLSATRTVCVETAALRVTPCQVTHTCAPCSSDDTCTPMQ